MKPDGPDAFEEKNRRIATIVSELQELHGMIEPKATEMHRTKHKALQDDIDRRIDFFAESAKETIVMSLDEIAMAIKTLRDWMVNHENVRLIGAGRAKLAGAIPVNRLAHGGARAYIIDDLIPMPHSSKQGGIIAVSASGITSTVIDALRQVRNEGSGITVIGIADHKADEFKQLCDIFIGIRHTEQPNLLKALADTNEYVISMILDAMVVAAGKMAGFDDITWRLGHENIGPTGPYDMKLHQHNGLEDNNKGITFLGRERELLDLQNLIEEMPKNGKNVLCLYGEPGVGKRSLIARFSKENCVRTKFKIIISVSAHNLGWQELIVKIAREVLGGIPPNATLSEIEQAIFDAAKKQSMLLILDNVEQKETKLLNFLQLWADASVSSIILTVHGNASGIRELENENFTFKKLSGIQDQRVIENLVGEVVMDYLKDLTLSDELRLLGGNPEKLLYLRWRSPKTKEEIENCLRDLVVWKINDKDLVIDPILKRINLPLDHFLSLGLIRTTVFDEQLLAYIWDRLDRGGTELYARTLSKLLSEGLLEWIDHSKLSMSTNVHAQLWNLAHSSGQEKGRLRVMDYFIAQYFRARFDDNRSSLLDLEALENYTYHYDRFGKVENACGYIIDARIIDEVLARGRTLEIEPILKLLETGLANRLRHGTSCEEAFSRAEVAWLTQMLACIKMNLGHVCKDLSRHKEALGYLEDAFKLLVPLSSSDFYGLEHYTSLSEIAHYRGIAYSQIGATLKCIESYLAGVEYAVANESFGPLDALSLGYLSYEFKFHDMQNAQLFGQWAVEISEKIGDRSIFVKNLCNLGQVLSFDSKFIESEEMFVRAEQLCDREVDQRTLCRILVNSAVTFIGLGKLDKAERKLEEAIRRFGESSDQRRRSMAKAYHGIILFHEGNEVESKKLIHEALKDHIQAGAQREIIYEALTLVWISYGGKVPGWPTVLKDKDLPVEVKTEIDRALNSCELSVFLDFWRNHYCPVLLDRKDGCLE